DNPALGVALSQLTCQRKARKPTTTDRYRNRTIRLKHQIVFRIKSSSFAHRLCLCMQAEPMDILICLINGLARGTLPQDARQALKNGRWHGSSVGTAVGICG